MEMLQRLRPALLHELKGPMQAILGGAHAPKTQSRRRRRAAAMIIMPT
jgi:hypothetical protein